jgi:hypothetical protein
MGWGLTWATVTFAQAAAATEAKGSDKTDFWIGAASSSLGLIPTWIAPPPMTTETLPTPDGSCESLKNFEALLNSYSDTDHLNSSWKSHISNVAVNVAVGLVLGLGYQHWSAAAISVAAGIPIGELMVFTYPGSAEKFRERYIRGDISEADFTKKSEENFWDKTRIAAAPASDGGTLLLRWRF